IARRCSGNRVRKAREFLHASLDRSAIGRPEGDALPVPRDRPPVIGQDDQCITSSVITDRFKQLPACPIPTSVHLDLLLKPLTISSAVTRVRSKSRPRFPRRVG